MANRVSFEVCGAGDRLDRGTGAAVGMKERAPYVLAVSSTHRLPTQAGPRRTDHLARRIPRRAWHKLSAGKGAKGH